jgi:DNA recombination protein RmuC
VNNIPVFVIMILLAFGLGVFVTWLLLRSRHLTQVHLFALRETGLQYELASAKEKLQQLLASQQELQQQLLHKDLMLAKVNAEAIELNTRLGQERKNFVEQLAILQNAKVELSKEFENIANKIFDNKQQQFSQSSKSLLESTLDPFKLQLSDFRKKVEDVYEKENADRNRLSGQVLELQKQAQKIGEDAVNLAQALKGNNKAQGNWGEVILERLLEESGLQKGREYDTQVNLTAEDGTRRMPDVIIHLPEQKDIIIDSKVSLSDYEKFCSSEDDQERKVYLTAHVNSLRNHIKGLSFKDYEKLDGIKALDFVLIFIPIEAAFMLALQHDPDLYRLAYDKHIILVSPTTLLATLRMVENIWRYEKQNKNAELIAKQAGDLHDKFVLLLESVDTLGVQINKTQDAYKKTRDRLHDGAGSLVKRVNNLRQLGAKTKKRIGTHSIQDIENAESLLLDVIEESPSVDDA